jgi:hypothetical protein
MNFSIKAYLKTDKKNTTTGRCPIEFIVNLNGRRTKLCLSGHYATEEIWDKKEGLIDCMSSNQSGHLLINS